MWKIAIALAVIPAITGCNPGQSSPAGTTPSDTSAPRSPAQTQRIERSNVAGPNAASASHTLIPPEAANVLQDIYGKEANGATRFEVDYGSWVGWWFGHRFTLNNRDYYTGFAWKTRETVGVEGAGDEVASQGHVAISQATYTAEDNTGRSAWKLIESDGYVGEFGANDQAPEVDATRQPVEYATEDHRLALAVPVREQGTAGFALFVYNPQERERTREAHWTYAGIVAGEQMAFLPAAAGLPRIQVAANAKLGKEALEYRYNQESGIYLR